MINIYRCIDVKTGYLYKKLPLLSAKMVFLRQKYPLNGVFSGYF
jgi:hypothetical protein